MSVKILSLVWEHSKASGTPLLVLLSLADYSDDTGECWPSISAIRRKCRLKDDRHVKRVIHETLEVELGEVVVIPGGGKASAKGGLRSNKYRIVVHLPETVAEEPLSDSGPPATVVTPDSGCTTTQIVVVQPPQIVAVQPPEPSVEPPGNRHSLAPAPLTPTIRKRDVLFDAMADALGIDPDELTSSARGTMNRALADLRNVGANPDEIYERADAYRRLYPNASLTPAALAKHWPQLTAQTVRASSPVGRALELARRAGR